VHSALQDHKSPRILLLYCLFGRRIIQGLRTPSTSRKGQIVQNNAFLVSSRAFFGDISRDDSRAERQAGQACHDITRQVKKPKLPKSSTPSHQFEPQKKPPRLRDDILPFCSFFSLNTALKIPIGLLGCKIGWHKKSDSGEDA